MGFRSRSAALALAAALACAMPSRPLASPAGAVPELRPGFAADSVWVFRLVRDSTHRDTGPRLRPVSRGVVSKADGRRLAALLGSVDLIRREAGAPHYCSECPGRLSLGFQFGSGPEALGVQASFPERAVFFSVGANYVGSAFCDSIAPSMLEIARATLSADSVLRHYVLPATMWDMPGGGPARRTDSLRVDVFPVAIEKPPPNYPAKARAAGIQGTVIVLALIGRDGEVKEARIRQSIPELDEAALEAVRHWKFKPALAAGQPLAVWVAIPVKFTLH
jgi:TonB family protein